MWIRITRLKLSNIIYCTCLIMEETHNCKKLNELRLTSEDTPRILSDAMFGSDTVRFYQEASSGDVFGCTTVLVPLIEVYVCLHLQLCVITSPKWRQVHQAQQV